MEVLVVGSTEAFAPVVLTGQSVAACCGTKVACFSFIRIKYGALRPEARMDGYSKYAAASLKV